MGLLQAEGLALASAFPASALAAGGQPAVERAIGRLRDEVERDMILMGLDNVSKLDRSKLQRGNPLDIDTWPSNR